MVRPLLAFVLLLGCAPAGGHADDDPLLAWRRRLADPAAYAIRDGLRIRDDALMAAIAEAREEHRDRLAQRWDADLRGLPTATAPAEPEYRLVATLQGLPGIHEAEAASQLADRGLRGTLRRSLAMVLPITMSTELGMPTADVGRWLAFFSLAEPEYTRCGGDDSLCVSYGGLDVFVFTMTRFDGVTVVQSIQWMQRSS
ncbi:MAG: hypothetical protein R3B09_06190 [Nannocystaceae bacterium]